MKSLITIIFLCGVFLLTEISCTLDTPKTVTVTGLGWVIENIPSTFWTTPVPSTCFYDFWIDYTGTFSIGDVEYARIYNSDKSRWWTIPLTSDFVTSRYIGGWYCGYDSDYLNTLPIGNLTAEIKLKNGAMSSFDKIIPAPGSTSNPGYTKVYTEECVPPPANSIEMLKRPGISGSTINPSGQNLMISFTIDDSRVYSGWVWLYDLSDNFVANTTLAFRNSTSGSLTSIINSSFPNLISANTVSIVNSDLTFATGRSFSDIAKYIVVVTDGNQFTSAGKYSSYDCRALSVRTAF